MSDVTTPHERTTLNRATSLPGSPAALRAPSHASLQGGSPGPKSVVRTSRIWRHDATFFQAVSYTGETGTVLRLHRSRGRHWEHIGSISLAVGDAQGAVKAMRELLAQLESTR